MPIKTGRTTVHYTYLEPNMNNIDSVLGQEAGLAEAKISSDSKDRAG